MTDPRTILVVEDDLDISDTLRDVLGEAGYTVACSDNGQAALDYLRTHPAPGLILLDLMMPLMDGARFRGHQVQDPRLADIPVIVLTASRDSTRVNELAAAAWVKKPFNLEELLTLVRRFAEPDAALPARRSRR